MSDDADWNPNWWKELKEQSLERKVKLAHSTPCFEFWLLLHVAGFTTRTDLVNGDATKRAVQHALGRDYATSELAAREAMSTFISNWPEAARHAMKVRKHHNDAGTPIPANPSTEVDLLVRALNDSALEHLRKTIR